MSEETLKWLSSLHPGDISAYAILALILVGGVYAIHKDLLVFGPRWRDKVEECKACKVEKDDLAAALTKANDVIKAARDEDTAKVIEIARLRMEREYQQWRQPSQPGTAP